MTAIGEDTRHQMGEGDMWQLIDTYAGGVETAITEGRYEDGSTVIDTSLDNLHPATLQDIVHRLNRKRFLTPHGRYLEIVHTQGSTFVLCDYVRPTT